VSAGVKLSRGFKSHPPRQIIKPSEMAVFN
jgi:hypothetical protein